jgi:hypothetical protein
MEFIESVTHILKHTPSTSLSPTAIQHMMEGYNDAAAESLMMVEGLVKEIVECDGGVMRGLDRLKQLNEVYEKVLRKVFTCNDCT